MKVYITKFALTKGIEQKEASPLRDNIVSVNHGDNSSQLFFKPDWHETREQAIAQAVKMKKIKIDALKAQIDKLNRLYF